MRGNGQHLATQRLDQLTELTLRVQDPFKDSSIFSPNSYTSLEIPRFLYCSSKNWFIAVFNPLYVIERNSLYAVIKLFKINKNIQDTLSLCVTRSGAKKPVTTHSCTCLLRTNRTCSISVHPMSFMSFVDFSQFNLRFCEFRIYFTAR